MAYRGFTWSGLGWRFLAGLGLVLTTYNPEGYSYFHWVTRGIADITPLMLLAGVGLVIGWTIFVRAAWRSLGVFGLALALAFFGSLLWLVVDMGLLPHDSARVMSYLILVLIAAVLSIGLSWSHVRRRLSGQADIDDVDE